MVIRLISWSRGTQHSIKRADSSSKLSTVSDDDRFGGSSGLRSSSLHKVKNFGSLADLSENDVLAIKMWEGFEAEEELRTVGSWSSVSHGEDSLSRVPVVEVLVFEVWSVDGFSTSSVEFSEISSLGHESWNDSVECASLEVKWLSESSNSLLSSAKSSEVFGGLWGVLVEVDLNASS